MNENSITNYCSKFRYLYPWMANRPYNSFHIFILYSWFLNSIWLCKAFHTNHYQESFQHKHIILLSPARLTCCKCTQFCPSLKVKYFYKYLFKVTIYRKHYIYIFKVLIGEKRIISWLTSVIIVLFKNVYHLYFKNGVANNDQDGGWAHRGRRTQAMILWHWIPTTLKKKIN